ncbi:galactoside alpha-(1,2)-fucosyltransferase 2 [Patella vulgata]|uniref:galactoside alpha-(1,2)-fucosyltransferase 2 n=1 Tax=Patella vulgata TaxID=6465 RepID=UPI00217F968B|nr:galactoside alpha-(1,2)-fucosyltransferase 2 [Patella vulgata]XP_050414339.1 galactoside alpha-(1,2)-fucosyltransferase 2 [Patella vulgata]
MLRRMRMRRGRLGIVLSIFFVCFLMLRYKGYSNQIYRLLYATFDTVYSYDQSRPHFCCTVFQGGLGNLLFQYAFSYGLAKDRNLTLLVSKDELGQLQQVFQIPNTSFDERGHRVCRYSKKYEDKYDVGYDSSIIAVSNNTDLHFEGYFQSWVYWRDYDDDLRQQIQFHPQVLTQAKRLLAEALGTLGKISREVTLVGIHVRRGDMITNDYFKNYGYKVADEKYLATAMKYIRDRVKGDIVYVVCSNDMVWTKKAITDPNAVFINGTKREYDMAALTLCDHFIMTVGTFGWWTGFLARGIIIYYDMPFRPGTPLAKNWASDYKETFFYPGWIGMR